MGARPDDTTVSSGAGVAACCDELPLGACALGAPSDEPDAALAVLSGRELEGASFAGVASFAPCAEAATWPAPIGEVSVTRALVGAPMTMLAAGPSAGAGAVFTGGLRVTAAATGCARLAAAWA